jgi:hypothetical protein
MWQRYVLTAVIAGLPVALCCGRAAGQESAPTEYQLKAAFLFNFAKFVEWPPSDFSSPHSEFSICILGADPFGAAIDELLRGQTINGHAVVVARARQVSELRHCQIAFISASEAGRLQLILQGTRGAGVLLVGESPGFTAAGGMIQFQMQNSRIRFSINPDAAERAGLRVSSKLLSLATVVHGAENGPGT